MTQTLNLELDEAQSTLLQAILPHVTFDGWSKESFDLAVQEVGLDPNLVRAICPSGALDLAMLSHRQGDVSFAAAWSEIDHSEMRIREKITGSVKLRLKQIEDKEIVRRATALFALPQNTKKGADLIWGTADTIWIAIGDTSDDFNWYTKRATLSAVYGATVLFWLGDESEDAQDTWKFLDRRIENVMQIEIVKGKIRNNETLSRVLAGPKKVLDQIRSPAANARDNLPGTGRG